MGNIMDIMDGVEIGMERMMRIGQAREVKEFMEKDIGATSWEAANELIRDALRTSLIPTINSMLVMGIVSLPGMMTGQILAGVSPGEAVRYQIIVVFIISAAAALGSTAVIVLAFRVLFSSRHQLLFDRLRKVN